MSGASASGYPYAVGSDALTDWPATSLALANRLEGLPWAPITVWGANWGPLNPGDAASRPEFCVDHHGWAHVRGQIAKSGTPAAGDSVCDLNSAYARGRGNDYWPVFLWNAPGGVAVMVVLRVGQGQSLLQLSNLGQGFNWGPGSFMTLSGGFATTQSH